MSFEEHERRRRVLRAAAIAASLVVVAALSGLLGACLGAGDPAEVPEVAPERGGAWPPPPRRALSADGGEVVIELRVWQHIDDPMDVWVHGRPLGGDWETPGPVRFPLAETPPAYARALGDYHRDLTVGGVDLRLYQFRRAPERIFVSVCVTPCPTKGLTPTEFDPRGEVPWWELWPWQQPWWTPLGMIPLSFDDGRSALGRHRYSLVDSESGDYGYSNLTLAVPVGNPELAADRVHLLALRDILAGTAELNWSAGTPTSEWEGVRLTGRPPRVTALNLADRGLDGEIWGWLGDLTELKELRLDGNHLTGTVPSKLAQLTGLTQLGLAGNALEGCIPPPLGDTTYHDLAPLALPDCDPPNLVFGDIRNAPVDTPSLDGGTYRWGVRWFGVMELPTGMEFQIFAPDGGNGRIYVVVAFGRGNWLSLYSNATENARSHYAEDDPARFAILEQIAASVWVTEADDRGEWVWP